MTGDRTGLRLPGAVRGPPPPTTPAPALTLFWQVQSLHCRLHRECPHVARAPRRPLAAGLLAQVPLLPHASLWLWQLLGSGARAGWEHTLNQLLDSKEVSGTGMHMSAQLPKVLALQQDGCERVAEAPGWGRRGWGRRASAGRQAPTHLGLEEEMALRRLPVTPGPAYGLHVALEARGQPQVQHSPDIWPVQAHPEGHRGHHHPQPALHEGLLHPPPLPAAHAGMIGFRHGLPGSACRDDTDGRRSACVGGPVGPVLSQTHLHAPGPRPQGGGCGAEQRRARCPLVCGSKQ